MVWGTSESNPRVSWIFRLGSRASTDFDPLWGKTFTEIGLDSASCQVPDPSLSFL